MNRKLKIAVVGAGHWGSNLIRNFHELGVLYAVCDNSWDALSGHKQKYDNVKFIEDYKSLLADTAIDGVVIATPAKTHYSLAEASLIAGKDTFVEKPLAIKYSEAEKLVRLAESQKQILMVGHLMRYHPCIVKLKELIEGGAMGKVEYIYSNRLNLGKVRREENALWSFAPHDISVILYLLEMVPLQVSAVGGTYLQPNIADISLSNLLFDSGVRSHIFVSWLHPYKEQKLVVIGTEKMAAFDDVTETDKLVLYDKRIEFTQGNFVVKKPEGESIPFEQSEPLHNECRHFLECLISRKKPWTDGSEGLEVMRVLQACQKSLQLNGEPVLIGQVNTEIFYA